MIRDPSTLERGIAVEAAPLVGRDFDRRSHRTARHRNEQVPAVTGSVVSRSNRPATACAPKWPTRVTTADRRPGAARSGHSAMAIARGARPGNPIHGGIFFDGWYHRDGHRRWKYSP